MNTPNISHLDALNINVNYLLCLLYACIYSVPVGIVRSFYVLLRSPSTVEIGSVKNALNNENAEMSGNIDTQKRADSGFVFRL